MSNSTEETTNPGTDPSELKINKKTLMKTLKDADQFISEISEYLPAHLRKKADVSEDDDVKEEEDDKAKINGETNEEKENGKMSASYGKKSRAQTIAELHERLQELKGKKTGYQSKLIKKGLKNRLKKKKKLEDRKQKKMLMAVHKAGGSGFIPKPSTETRNIKPVFNSEGNMVFSKFDFTESNSGKDSKKKSDKDPKRALQRIEKTKSKIQDLEQSGQTDKALELKQKQLWKSAIQRAEGVKVKDDVELLKKSIKKNQNKKNKSKKQWEEREDQVRKKKDDGQKKRKDNLMQRKKDKKDKKIKKAVKKGRLVQ